MSHHQHRRALARLVSLLMVALLALSACSSGSAPPPGQSAGGEPASGTRVMSFTGTTLAGATFDGASETGPVVLRFWAPWCTICRAEAPDVAAVAAELAGQVTFVGVPGRGDQGAMKDFVSQTKTGGFEHVPDLDGSLWQRFGIVSQPAFVFVDGSGKATLFGGSLDAAGLRQMIQPLLAS